MKFGKDVDLDTLPEKDLIEYLSIRWVELSVVFESGTKRDITQAIAIGKEAIKTNASGISVGRYYNEGIAPLPVLHRHFFINIIP